MLKRLISISQTKPKYKYKPKFKTQRHKSSKKSRYSIKRKFEQKRIQRENQAMALRLIKMNPTMSNKKWRRVENNQRKYANIRSKYGKGRRTQLPPINRYGEEVYQEELQNENQHMQMQMVQNKENDEAPTQQGWQQQEHYDADLERELQRKLEQQMISNQQMLQQSEEKPQVARDQLEEDDQQEQQQEEQEQEQVIPEVQAKTTIRQIQQDDGIAIQKPHEVQEQQQIKLKQFIPENDDEEPEVEIQNEQEDQVQQNQQPAEENEAKQNSDDLDNFDF